MTSMTSFVVNPGRATFMPSISPRPVIWMVWRLPETDGPVTALSLVFPVYYIALSLWLDWKTRP